jgi:spoIIIJ-associated protein
MEDIVAILKKMLDALGVSYSGIEQASVAGQEIFSIRTDDPRTLIGARGDTIHALDILVKKIYEKQMPPAKESEAPSIPPGARERMPMFLVDVNDYRTKQIKDLQAKAVMMAERVRSFQYDVELSPMSSYERLIIHTTLQDSPNVKTESQGEGRSRRVVIKYSSE